ncbi:StAR-related lipid transfer protein 9 [Armadillidium vulgare]|nr:StAR-related lipid transfer protein 9 [Armadillidium vulgare]
MYYSPGLSQGFANLIEIYKERVRDLLSEVKNARVLRVREHPTTGPYVDGVTWHSIGNVEIAWNLLERGRAARSVGPTSIHAHSSSERANEACDKNRLKEGASINRSLVTLGNVISALAERGLGVSATKVRSISCPQVIQRTPMEEGGSWGCPGPPHSHQSQKAKFSQGHGPRLPFIPYRDSVLTWLLKDTLGGNSNTFMIATLSPSSTCYKESLSTMRYATRARRIVNRPVVNVDPTTTTISSLKQEIALLRQLLYYRYKDSFDRLSFGGKFSLQDSSSKITSQKPDKQKQHINNANSPKRKNATAIPPDGSSGNGTRDKGTSVLGTGQNCDLRVPGNGVNSFHCSLTHGYGHSGVTLRVLCGSLQVENTRIVKGEVVRLRDGNIIRIGSREFTFSFGHSYRNEEETA